MLVVLRELAAFSCEMPMMFGSGFCTWVVLFCGRVATGLEGRPAFREPRGCGRCS